MLAILHPLPPPYLNMTSPIDEINLSMTELEDARDGGVTDDCPSDASSDTAGSVTKNDKVKQRLMISRLFRDKTFLKNLSGVIRSHVPNYEVIERQTFLMANEASQTTLQISGMIYYENHVHTFMDTFGRGFTDKIKTQFAYIKNQNHCFLQL